MTTGMFKMTATAEAEVVKADHDHVEECVALHPGEPCPGYPHESPQED